MEGDETVVVESHEEGGTFSYGGTNEAMLNVTYNYGRFYRLYLDEEDGLKWLDGKKASETTERLERALRILGAERDRDYWASTSGNAGFALAILLYWAKLNPDAVWKVS